MSNVKGAWGYKPSKSPPRSSSRKSKSPQNTSKQLLEQMKGTLYILSFHMIVNIEAVSFMKYCRLSRESSTIRVTI